jgi:phage shock protein A
VKNKAEVDQLIAKAEEELAGLNTERAKVIERLKSLRVERSQIESTHLKMPR